MNMIKRLTLLVVWIVVVIAATLLFVQALFADETRSGVDDRPWWTVEVRVGLGEAEPASVKGGDPTEEEPDIDPLLASGLGRGCGDGLELLRFTNRFVELVICWD